MNVIDASSSKQGHPLTLKIETAILYRFDSGHKLTRYADGTRFYSNTRRALNHRTDTKICAKMDNLIAQFDKR